MANVAPPPVIQQAILSPITQRTRRFEIYEQDGTTLWMDGADRLKDGSVSLTYSDDSRRSFDITIDNSDGALKEDPYQGLWYDKVFKVYSGVRLPTQSGEPIVGPSRDLALNKKVQVFVNGVLYPETYHNTYDIITDGKSLGAPTYFGANASGIQQAVVDLGAVWTIDTVKVWHYFLDARTYHNSKTEVSVDGQAWVTVFDSSRAGEYVEKTAGHTITFLPRAVRYIRDSTNGNTVDAYGDWYEIAAYQTQLEWETQVGEFVIDKITSQNWPLDVKVSGRDYVKRCETSKFTQTTTYSAGQSIEKVISAIASNARCYKQKLSPTFRTTQRDFTFDRGSDRWDAIKAITSAYGYEAFFDSNGFLVLQLAPDPAMQPITYTFEIGTLGNIASYSRSTADTELYNHVLVTGESSDSNIPPVWGEAINTEPTSPTNIDAIGDRLYTYTSSFITTTQQAKDVALSFLKVHALEAFEVALTTLVIPWLDPGSIVEFLDPDPITNQPTRYLLSDFTIPLALGTMSVTAKRVTIVSDNGQGGKQGLGRVLYQPGLSVTDLVANDDGS